MLCTPMCPCYGIWAMEFAFTATLLKPSDDLQDVLHIAGKLAKKQHAEGLSDRLVLQAFVKSARMFSSQDSLLKLAGTSPKRLGAVLAQKIVSFPDSSANQALLQTAETFAQKSASPVIELEHLLLALLVSFDPALKETFAEVGLTADRVKASLPELKTTKPQRFALYCVKEFLEVIVVVLVMICVIRQGLGELRLIPSESMVPTLQIDDRVVVERVSQWTRPPHRGDILVFYPPEPLSILKKDPLSLLLRATGFSGIFFNKESRIDTAYIKRVIGLPGDILQVKPDDGVYINGKKLREPYVNEIAQTCTIPQAGPMGCSAIKIPPHSYFMMGDNRNHSEDSRYWLFLPEKRIIGRAVFRFWPLNRVGILDNPYDPPSLTTKTASKVSGK